MTDDGTVAHKTTSDSRPSLADTFVGADSAGDADYRDDGIVTHFASPCFWQAIKKPRTFSGGASGEVDATGLTTRARLPKPWPILILYWTAELDGEGHVRFLPDAYGRDPPLLQALNGNVVIDFPSL